MDHNPPPSYLRFIIRVILALLLSIAILDSTFLTSKNHDQLSPSLQNRDLTTPSQTVPDLITPDQHAPTPPPPTFKGSFTLIYPSHSDIIFICITALFLLITLIAGVVVCWIYLKQYNTVLFPSPLPCPLSNFIHLLPILQF